MEKEFKELMDKIEALTQILTKENYPGMSLIEIPDNQICGDVCYTRLYKDDEKLMDDICKKSGRKKASIIRILVSDGLRRGIINA